MFGKRCNCSNGAGALGRVTSEGWNFPGCYKSATFFIGF
jgi:hypothetical protein